MDEKIINHVVFVLDHSGSMASIKDVSRDNFNEQLAFLQKEVKGQETFVTLVEFDDEIKTVFTDKPVHEVKPLNDYWTGGMTALNDAIAYGIHELSHIEALNDADSEHAALVVIITDGHENASSDYSGKEGAARVKELITDKELTTNWTFTFLGANLDVQEAAKDYAFAAGNTMSFDSTVSGAKMSNEVIKTSFTSYFSARSMGVKSVKDFYTVSEPKDGSE